MPPEGRNLVYLCADRGIPIGGVKGASVHVGEFISALREARFDVRTLAARFAAGTSPDPLAASLSEREAAFAPFFIAAQAEPSLQYTLRETRDVLLNAHVADVLVEWHRSRPIDVLYERYSLFGMAGRSFAARHGIPYLLEVNAPLIEEAATYRELRARDLATSVARFLFRTADGVLAVSNVVAEYVRSHAPEARITVLPNAVDPRRFQTAHELPDEGRHGNADEFRIGFVGSVRPWHGVDRLLDAFGLLVQVDSRASLRIVGEAGALRGELLQRCHDLRIADKVTFTGAVPFESIPAELSELDVVVAPYPEMETFYFSPLKIFEYMAAGTAIVASAIGQIQEVLHHERTALLVPPGDREALCRALDRLRKDPGLRRSLGEAAREEAIAHHTWQARVSALERLLERLPQSQLATTGEVRAAQA